MRAVRVVGKLRGGAVWGLCLLSPLEGSSISGARLLVPCTRWLGTAEGTAEGSALVFSSRDAPRRGLQENRRVEKHQRGGREGRLGSLLGSL